MSLNGNQVLHRSARAGLLLHRQLHTSRGSFTSSAGAPTSNAPLMADKVIWLGQTGQQMGMEKKKKGKENILFSGPLFKSQASYFHWMLRGNRLPLYGRAIKKKKKKVESSACQSSRKKKKCEGKNDRRVVSQLERRKSQHRRGVKRSNIPQRSYRGNSRVI